MSEIILSDIEDYQKIIAEEKEEWVYQVLIGLGIPEEVIIDLGNEEILEYLMGVDIEIFNHLGNNSIEIMREGKVVAEWKEPKLIRKKDKKGKHYYEIHFDEWALPFQMARRERSK